MTANTAPLDPMRYPVGKFAAPAAFDARQVRDARDEIAAMPDHLRDAIRGLDEAQLDTPYRDGGWTVRQVVHHVADSHLNAAFRFRLALTEDAPTIKPYLEARWAELPDARTEPVDASLQQLIGGHARWVALMDAMTPEQWDRTFVHPEHPKPLTLWHTAGLYAWHSRHHVAHVTNLRQRMEWG